jgi:hypothetical protein
MQMAQMYAHMDCKDQVQFILGHMSLKQKAICGLPHKTGQELLYLPPPSSQSDLRHMGYYLILLVEEFGSVIWVYDGSGRGPLENMWYYARICKDRNQKLYLNLQGILMKRQVGLFRMRITSIASCMKA